jgi:hypothetical protein
VASGAGCWPRGCGKNGSGSEPSLARAMQRVCGDNAAGCERGADGIVPRHAGGSVREASCWGPRAAAGCAGDRALHRAMLEVQCWRCMWWWRRAEDPMRLDLGSVGAPWSFEKLWLGPRSGHGDGVQTS